MTLENRVEEPDPVPDAFAEARSARAAGRRTALERFLGVLAIFAIFAVCVGYGLLLFSLLGLAVSDELAEEVDVAILLEPAIRILAPSLTASTLIYFALYMARRRRLARIEIEGHVFEADPVAWGYAMRALGYLIPTVVSFGILLPLHTFQLQKYVTSRCRLSGIMFGQGGHWAALYPAMMHLFIGSAVAVVFALSGIVFGVMGGLLWAAAGAALYRARSIDYLAKRQSLSSFGEALLPRARGEMRLGDFPMTNMYVARAISRAAFTLPDLAPELPAPGDWPRMKPNIVMAGREMSLSSNPGGDRDVGAGDEEGLERGFDAMNANEASRPFLNEFMDRLEALGWRSCRDDFNDRVLEFRLPDRVVRMFAELSGESELALTLTVTTAEFDEADRIIHGEINLVSRLEVSEESILIDISSGSLEDRARQASDEATAWAERQDIDKALEEMAASPASFPGAPVWHLAALALQGDVRRLRSYRARFDAGDRGLGFATYVRSDFIDRAIALALKKAP